jgi:hypothetical protein
MHRTVLLGFVSALACGRNLDLPETFAPPAVVDLDVVITDASDAGLDSPVATARTDANNASYAFLPSARSPSFVDVFSRPDGDVGGGWQVKTSSTFELASGALRQTASKSIGYEDLLALRPEMMMDGEVSVMLQLGADAADWHMVLARVQGISDIANRFLGYALCVNAAGLSVGNFSKDETMQRGPCGFATALSSSLVALHGYRVFFRVSGIDPVVLEGAVFDGVQRLGSVRFEDLGPYRIPTSGRWGIGGGSVEARWDEFTKLEL